MEPTYPPEPPPGWAQLTRAVAAGAVRLLDEHGHALSLAQGLTQPCWAQLRDWQDGRVYVQKISGSRELLAPRYLELVGFPEPFPQGS